MVHRFDKGSRGSVKKLDSIEERLSKKLSRTGSSFYKEGGSAAPTAKQLDPT